MTVATLFLDVCHAFYKRVLIRDIIRIYFRDRSSRLLRTRASTYIKGPRARAIFNFRPSAKSSSPCTPFFYCVSANRNNFRFVFLNVCILVILMSLERAVRAKVSQC